MEEIELDPEAGLYTDNGMCQAVARHPAFTRFFFLCVVANIIYIGVDAQTHSGQLLYESPSHVIVIENCFCFFFLIEWIVRFLAMKNVWSAFEDLWFRLDTMLIVLQVVEVWISALWFAINPESMAAVPTPALRVLRLLRVTRLLRVARYFPELLMLVMAMKVATRAVFSTVVMMSMFTYGFAIAINEVMSENDRENLKIVRVADLSEIFWTLVIDGTLLNDPGKLIFALFDGSNVRTVGCAFMFMVFLGLSALTLMNMLIGVMCEVMASFAAQEKDEADIYLMKGTILAELKKFDGDGNGMISNEELSMTIKDPQSIEVFRKLNINTDYLEDVQDMVFRNNVFTREHEDGDHSKVHGLPIERIIEMMLMCRGDLPVTVKNLVQCHFVTCQQLYEAIIPHIDQRLNGIRQAMSQATERRGEASMTREQITVEASKDGVGSNKAETVGI